MLLLVPPARSLSRSVEPKHRNRKLQLAFTVFPFRRHTSAAAAVTQAITAWGRTSEKGTERTNSPLRIRSNPLGGRHRPSTLSFPRRPAPCGRAESELPRRSPPPPAAANFASLPKTATSPANSGRPGPAPLRFSVSPSSPAPRSSHLISTPQTPTKPQHGGGSLHLLLPPPGRVLAPAGPFRVPPAPRPPRRHRRHMVRAPTPSCDSFLLQAFAYVRATAVCAGGGGGSARGR
jgi:hypothetical protein